MYLLEILYEIPICDVFNFFFLTIWPFKVYLFRMGVQWSGRETPARPGAQFRPAISVGSLTLHVQQKST